MKTLYKLLLLVLLAGPCCALWAQEVHPTWESINRRGYPQWFSDAKLGIFIHWGLYSVPAYASKEGYAEWLYRGLMLEDSGRVAIMRNYPPKDGSAPLSVQERYGALRDYWHAELWDADEWARIFKGSGAQYVLLVTKHHDGYCLWDYSTLLKDWNSVVSGPKRNIVEELTTAVRKQGLKMGFYFSLAEWSNPLHRWTVSPHDSIAPYVERYMIPQFKDLVSRYRPSLIFTDGEWDNNAEQWHARELISWYYNTVGPEAVVNDRWGHGHEHGYKTPEYSGGIMDTVTPWAECRGLGRSFGLNRNEPLENYLTSDELIQHFAKLVAAGGGLTLNIGPSADGHIPMIQQERLRELGEWLKVNGESIYGARTWRQPYEYRQVEYFRKDSVLDFDWVRNAPIKGMTYDNFQVEWTGVIVPEYSEAYTFRVEVDDDALVILDGDTLLNYHKGMVNATQSNAQEANNSKHTQTTIKLSKGQHCQLRVLYRENDLEAVMRLRWSSKSQPECPVPAIGGFSGKYSCQQPQVCYTRKGNALYAILFSRPDRQVGLHNVPQPGANTSVHLLGCDAKLPWHLVNGVMVVDFTGLEAQQIDKSRSAWVLKIDNVDL